MTEIFSVLLQKIRLFLNINFISSSKEVGHIKQESVLYAFGFPVESLSLLSKLYQERKIVYISKESDLSNYIEDIVFYKKERISLNYQSEISVNDVFNIGAEGQEFHRNLYILSTLEKYSTDDCFISYFKEKRLQILVDITQTLILNNKKDHNLYNIQALLLKKKADFYRIIALAHVAKENLSSKKLVFIEKVINESISEQPIDIHILKKKRIKKILFDLAPDLYSINIPCNFVKFPTSLHESINYIFPYLEISFIDEIQSSNNIFYTSKFAEQHSYSFENSLKILELGNNEKTLHHNLYILSFLFKLGYYTELNEFAFNHEDFNTLQKISRTIQSDSKDISHINISCIFYSRLSDSQNFFKQVAKLDVNDNLLFITSLIKEGIIFDENDIIAIDNIALLRSFAFQLYKDMYYEEAVIFFKRLVCLEERDCLVYVGLALYKLNILSEAEEIFRQLLGEDKSSYVNWSYIGLVNMKKLKYDEAIHSYQEVLKRYPFKKDIKSLKDLANYHQIIANAAVRCNRKKLALYHYFSSVIYWPSNYGVFTVLHTESKTLYILAKRWIHLIEQCLALSIKFYSSNDDSLRKKTVNKILESSFLPLFDRLSKIIPNLKIDTNKYIDLIGNGNIRFLKKQQQLIYTTIGRINILDGFYDDGLHKLLTATELTDQTKFIEPNIWLANFYLSTQKYDFAITQFNKALNIIPNDKQAIIGIASCYVEQGFYVEAKSYIKEKEQFFSQKKNSELTRVIKQNYAFGTKDYQKAWSYYKEILLSRSLKVDSSIDYVQSLLNLEANDRVLLVALWGPGDEIRWASLYQKLYSKFTNLTISCEPRLQTLMSRAFPDITFLSSSRTIRGKYDYKNYGLYSELPNVALISAFDNNLYSFAKSQDKTILVTDILEDLIDSESSFLLDRGYLSPELELQTYWKSKLEKLGGKPKIGICWKSGLVNLDRNIHYTEIEEWLPLLSNSNFIFINLQYAGYEEDIELLKSKYDIEIVNFEELDLRDDFEGTSALMTNLDYIISPCTTIAELAGALGVPTLLTSNAPDIVSRIQTDTNQDLWFKSIQHIRASSLGDKASIVTKVADFLGNKFDV